MVFIVPLTFFFLQIFVVVIFVFVSLKHSSRKHFFIFTGIAHIFKKTILNSSKFGTGRSTDGTDVLGVALGHVTMVTLSV